ncbi:YitT family protein [Hazenella coriacea]|uniref:Uncharacterized membrane-anchored protein YitT (DUF2179 family) n=1 Tax=Hazenella coriacea TaxID=1179467 RepID=A0A4R3L3W2_9BACL|nr:YitT family protein [Hazenella coriacea]TCS93370.1 uncharacterized membrane-anchored protein YitT (DUF2179 family) [Hazenella coriacea]
MTHKITLHIRNIFIILLGSTIFAIGINYFAIPNQLAEGGFTGIALILNYLFDWSPGLLIFILNIPLLFVGYKVFGKRTLVYTIVGISGVSIMLELTKSLAENTKPLGDLLLVALYTGVLTGIGLGMIFRVGGTTGGVDIIARLVNKYFGWSIGRTMFLFDLAVISSTIFLFNLQMAMYTLVAVFVGARVIDFVVEGLSASKAAMIISNSAQDVATTITQKMGRGVTILKGKGAYTGAEKEVLYVVVAPNEMPKLKQIVHERDPYAFVVVNDARDVHGEGFSFERTDQDHPNPHQ